MLSLALCVQANKALHLKSHMYRKRRHYAEPQKDIKPLLAVAKTSRKYHWLKQYDSIALQQAVINLHQPCQLLQPEVKSQIPAI